MRKKRPVGFACVLTRHFAGSIEMNSTTPSRISPPIEALCGELASKESPLFLQACPQQKECITAVEQVTDRGGSVVFGWRSYFPAGFMPSWDAYECLPQFPHRQRRRGNSLPRRKRPWYERWNRLPLGPLGLSLDW
jgi:hypothetical protein